MLYYRYVIKLYSIVRSADEFLHNFRFLILFLICGYQFTLDAGCAGQVR
jgi:hypothetical protein